VQRFTSRCTVERKYMTLEKQVCSLDLAKRLKELGVKQESEYEWEQERSDGKAYLKTSGIRGCRRCGAIINGFPRPRITVEHYAAFSVAELGELLPYEIKRSEQGQDRTLILTIKHQCVISYKEKWNYRETPECKGRTEADARAKMLIYLLDNKLMEAR
jgi:hypothetical protein